MNQILVVDDDAAFSKAVCHSISDLAATRTASSVSEALQILNTEPISLIITDYKLADGSSGLELVSKIKNFSQPPSVIMVTAFANTKMAIESVNLGVFAFIEKPFENEELRTHIMRALNPSPLKTTFQLNPSENSVVYEGESYALTKTEYEILSLFVSNPNKWLTREAIENAIWSEGRSGSRNIFDTHLTNLKKKCLFLKDRLETVRGRGYIFRDT